MNQFLRSLSSTQQVAALFVIVFGILVVVSVTAFLLTLPRAARRRTTRAWHAELKHFRKLLRTILVHGRGVLDGWAAGRHGRHGAVRA